MNTPLHDLMHRAVEDTAPDLVRISTAARSRGLAIRRRRQALSAVGAALAVAVIVVGAQLAGAPTRDVPAASSPSASASSGPSTSPAASPVPTPGPQVPFTGRAVAAGLNQALRDAVGSFHGGTSDFAGQASADEAYAQLHYQPTDLGGYSLIGINVQPGFANKEIYRCRDWQARCRILHPTRGATLMTYEERSATRDGLGIRVVADLLRADGVRVVASSANGEELPANRWHVTRDRPPLSATQLYLVVSEPWWGPTMDEAYDKVGQRIRGYEDLDSNIS